MTLDSFSGKPIWWIYILGNRFTSVFAFFISANLSYFVFFLLFTGAIAGGIYAGLFEPAPGVNGFTYALRHMARGLIIGG